MLTILVLFVGLTLATAVIAYWSDNLGKKLGKKRVSLWGLRPRTTATFLTIASSWLIMVFTLGVMLTIFPPLRQSLLRYDEVKANESNLDKSAKRLTGQVSGLKGQLMELREQTVGLETQVKAASDKLKNARGQLKQSREASAKARKNAAAARKDAADARKDAAAALARQKSAIESEKAASENFKRVSRRLNATQQQRQAAQKRLQIATDELKQADKKVQTANARVQAANARVNAANATVAAAKKNLTEVQKNLEAVQDDLKLAKSNEQTAKENEAISVAKAATADEDAATARARAAQSRKERINADRARIEADRQVLIAQEKVKQLTAQSEQLKSDNQELRRDNEELNSVNVQLNFDKQQAKSAAKFLAQSDVRVPVDSTLVERSFARSMSAFDARKELRAMFNYASGEVVPRLLPSANLTLVELPDGQNRLSADDIYDNLVNYISNSPNPLSVRLVAARNHLAGEDKLEARFLVVPTRPALSADFELANISADGRQSEGALFSRLLELVDAGTAFAKTRGLQPPLSPDVPNFYVPGSREQIFDALRAIKAVNAPVRVRILTAEPIETTDQLSVRFEVEPLGATTAKTSAQTSVRKAPA